MACYICEICQNLTDDDYNPGEEYEDGLVCQYCYTEFVAETTTPAGAGDDDQAGEPGF